MNHKILLVDDDANVLAGYERQLRKQYLIKTAPGGQAGLELLLQAGPFAVVVSDMRMPGMDGIEFLSQVHRHSPDTVCMMLTGNADLETCIHAVNEGRIFRFMTKPCSPETLIKALDAGVVQYKLITSERELLHGTLRGCIRTLADILSVLNPAAFSRGIRARRYVRHIAAQLNTPHFWEYEMAATLSQIGLVAVPPEILQRLSSGRSLTAEQHVTFMRHPIFGAQLLSEIPRLAMVAEIIGGQAKPVKRHLLPSADMPYADAVELGAQILHVALEIDRQIITGHSFIDSLQTMHLQYGPDHPLIEALMSFDKDKEDRVPMQITAGQLGNGMIAAENITSTTGYVLVPKGQSLTEPIRLYLLSCAQAEGLKQPFSVEVITEED